MTKTIIQKNSLNIKPFAPNLGAVITDIDLSIKITELELEGIRDAFHKYQVLFFQNQSEISPDNHINLGKCFGDVHIQPAAP